MRESRSYVVRIYWHDSRGLFGTIEDARANGKTAVSQRGRTIQIVAPTDP
jgi:hypothetical protein